MNQDNGHVPISVPLLGQDKPRVGANSIAAFIRKLDENGTFEPEKVVRLPNGQAKVEVGRSNFVDATELVTLVAEAVREVIREELATLKESNEERS